MATHNSASVDSQGLGSFFDEVARMLGEDNVSRTPIHGALEGFQGEKSYGDPFSTMGTHNPSGAVRPSAVEEVQEIMKLANKYNVSLWTVSRGKNLGYAANDVSHPYAVCILLTVTDMVDLAVSSKDALS